MCDEKKKAQNYVQIKYSNFEAKAPILYYLQNFTFAIATKFEVNVLVSFLLAD